MPKECLSLLRFGGRNSGWKPFSCVADGKPGILTLVMAADIIDNRRLRLAESIRALLADNAVAARFAVGYLFLDGLAPLREQIESLEEVYILMGNVVNRLTEEQVQEELAAHLPGGDAPAREQEDFTATLREAHARAARVTALNLRRTLGEMAPTPDARALLLTLARRIADGGLKVRLYTHGRIHAKIALVDYPPRAGQPCRIVIVGSSNLTLGAPAHPTEMNIVVRDRESTEALAQWYQGLWDQSQDFHRELFDELGQCWALQTQAAPPAAAETDGGSANAVLTT